jgi:AraC-like DNA-binding protein
MDHTLPAVWVFYLAELVKRWNVTLEELIEGTDIRPESVSDLSVRVPVPALIHVVERARALTGEPALGYYQGLQVRISMHGYLGFAALSAPTMRAATELMNQFTPIITTAVTTRLRIDGRDASIVVEENVDFGSARDHVLMALLVGIWQMGQAGTGRDLRGGTFDFVMPEPPYMARLRANPRVPTMRFGQPVNRILFDVSRLELTYRMSDPVALNLAREQCERELNALGLDGRVEARVRRLVSRNKNGFPSLQQVASQLHKSPRTLKRQLAAEGHTFSSILDEERREAATLMLRSSDFSIEQVAERLGYSNVPNFSRAFRRWMGITPADYRTRPPG